MTVDAVSLELETGRLLLHTLAPGDEARLQRVFEACADHFAILMGQRVAPDAAAQELASCAATPGRAVAILTLAATGEDVGAIGWWRGNPEPDRALLGMLMIHPAHRLQGLAREALSAVEVWLRGQGIVALRTAFQRRRLAVHPIVKAFGFQELSIREHALLGLGGVGVSLWERPVGG
ncbi:MAG TPA: GNAT family N-acetyltransferase [Longimicrobium sp.]|nr:GNAT family N-acetyltransferase [Longimicrobium sp.]